MAKYIFNAGVSIGGPQYAASTATMITVIDRSTDTLASLWSDRDGVSILGNPFPIQSSGQFFFYADDGRYQVTATNGTYSRTWEDIILGAAGGGEYTNVIESTTARTLGLSDHKKFIDCTNAAGCAITIPPQSSVVWLSDTEITGAGRLDSCTFIDTGVTVIIPDDRILECTKGSPWALRRIAEDVWLLYGDLLEVEPSKKYVTSLVTENITLTDDHLGLMLYTLVGNTSSIVVTVPSGLDSDGFHVSFVHRGSGTVTFIGSGATVNAQTGGTLVLAQRGRASLVGCGVSDVYDLVGVVVAAS